MVIRLRRIALNLLLTLCMVLSGGSLVSAQSTESTDVLIWTANEHDLAVFDICYELEGYSNIGCDENRDGNVRFQDIPYGTYTVIASYPNGSDYRVDPFQITVDANTNEFLAQAINQSSAQPTESGTTQLLLVTRDPETGESLTDVCYELVGFSNIGCDENQDGRVQFQDIPYSGAYTIRQTTTPAGYPKMDDYVVSVMRGDSNLPLTILLSQSKEQAPENTINVSVVFYDAVTGKPVGDADNCAQLRKGRDAVSNIGCDENVIDGQVDFMHVDWVPNDANYSLRATPMCGYEIVQQQSLDIYWPGQNTLIIYIPLEFGGEACN